MREKIYVRDEEGIQEVKKLLTALIEDGKVHVIIEQYEEKYDE